MLLDKALQKLLKLRIEISSRSIKLIAYRIYGFRDDRVDDHAARGAVVRRARGAEFELVARKGERRGSVAVGRVARQRRHRIDAILRKLLYFARISVNYLQSK